MNIYCRKLIDEIKAVNAKFASITDRGSYQAEMEIQLIVSRAWPRIAALAEVAEVADKPTTAPATAGFNI